MLNYNHVYYFHVAASEGSVARAAERLGVTQPTVSEQLRLLERALGVPLFERTSTGLRLTEAGKQAYEHTTAMFRAGERLSEVFGKRPALPCALKVGITAAVSRSTASDFLMPVLHLDECVPDIRTGGAFGDLIKELRTGELDLLLCETEPLDGARRGLEVVTITRPRIVAIGHNGMIPDPDWANVSLVHYRVGSPVRWEIDGYLDEHALRPRIAAETDDPQLMVEAATRGKFAAFVPRTVARDAIETGRVQLLATLDPDGIAVHAIYPDGNTAALARQVAQRLVEHARKHSDS